MAQSSPLSSSIIAQLEKYSACDISDALLKLKAPGAGYVADLLAYSPHQASQAATSSQPVTVAPVSTVLFAPKGQQPAGGSEGGGALPAQNIPKDVHWADLAEPGTFVVLKQPEGQTNAVCGGIMALRMKVRQVAGIIVAGRVRDLDELRSTNLPVRAPSNSPLPLDTSMTATQPPLLPLLGTLLTRDTPPPLSPLGYALLYKA
jgi:regulator of RNase E activity RraA